MTQDEKAVLLDNALNNLESAIRSHGWHVAQMVYIAKSDDEANRYSACCDEAMIVIATTRDEIFKLAGLNPPAEVSA